MHSAAIRNDVRILARIVLVLIMNRGEGQILGTALLHFIPLRIARTLRGSDGVHYLNYVHSIAVVGRE